MLFSQDSKLKAALLQRKENTKTVTRKTWHQRSLLLHLPEQN